MQTDKTTGLILQLLAFTTISYAAWFGGGSYDGFDDSTGGGAPDLPQVSNAQGATNVTDFSAWLNGMLTHTGAAPAQVFVFWGKTDGGTTKANWTHNHNFGIVNEFETLSLNVPIDSGSQYYYRFYATNSANEEGWAYPESATFITWDTPAVTNLGYEVGRHSAVFNGELLTGYKAEITISWGTDPNNWSATTNLGVIAQQGTEAAPNPFQALTDDLLPETTYAYRISAVNDFGTDETTLTWFTTGSNNFITSDDTSWFGGGYFDGYDYGTFEDLLPASGGVILFFK